MKKGICICFVLAVLAVFFSSGIGNGFASASLSQSPPRQDLRENAARTDAGAYSALPFSLLAIEDEAFEGTALRRVVLPENLRAIGENAFANIRTLAAVYIPESVTFIADTAFFHDDDLAVFGEAGSFAEKWSLENGLRFIRVSALPDAGFAGENSESHSQRAVPLLLAAFALLLFLDLNRISHSRRPDEGCSMRPQERAELHDICCRFP